MPREIRSRQEGAGNGRIDLPSAEALGEADGRDPQYVNIADQETPYPPRGLAEISAQIRAELRALIEGRDERVSELDRTAAEKFIAVQSLFNRKLEINHALEDIEERFRKLHQALPAPGSRPASTGRDQWGVELERVRIDRRKILADDQWVRHAMTELVSWINGADLERRQAQREFLSRADSVLEHAKALVAAYLHGFNRRHPRRERVREKWHPPTPGMPADGLADLPPFSVDLETLEALWKVFLWFYRHAN